MADNLLSGERPRILVVDDNDDNRFTLTLHLDLEVYTNVDASHHGEEPIQPTQAASFDMLLLDVMIRKRRLPVLPG